MITLGFKKVHPDAKLPTYAHEGDAGMDVCAVEETWLKPFRPTLVKTGLVPSIPEGYEIQVRPRSGLALKNGVTVWNSPGTVDAGYRGEIGVIMLWTPHACKKDAEGDLPSSFVICKGDKIAQLVLAPVTTCYPVEVEEVNTDTGRGAGGFGSTGK